MAKKDNPTSKLKTSAIKKRPSRGKTAKLKSSTWYDGAAQLFKISSAKQPKAKRRD